MALPTLHRKLFQNDGYGPLLKDEIVSRRISVQDWSNAYNYAAGVFARGSDDAVYMSKQPSGPSSAAVDPVQDDGTFWQKMLVQTLAVDDYSDSSATTKWVQDYLSSRSGESANVVVYVNGNTGNDANDGLTKATAKKTIAAALNVGLFKFSTTQFTVNIAPAVYNESIAGVYGRVVEYVGELVGSDSPVVNTIIAATNTTLLLNGYFKTKEIGVGSNSLMQFTGYSSIEFPNVGSVPDVIGVTRNGTLYIPTGVGVNFTLTGTAGTVSAGTVIVQDGGVFKIHGVMAWGGTINGKRYSISHGSVLSGAGSTTAIPGTQNGTVDATSYYG